MPFCNSSAEILFWKGEDFSSHPLGWDENFHSPSFGNFHSPSFGKDLKQALSSKKVNSLGKETEPRGVTTDVAHHGAQLPTLL